MARLEEFGGDPQYAVGRRTPSPPRAARRPQPLAADRHTRSAARWSPGRRRPSPAAHRRSSATVRGPPTHPHRGRSSHRGEDHPPPAGAGHRCLPPAPRDPAIRSAGDPDSVACLRREVEHADPRLRVGAAQHDQPVGNCPQPRARARAPAHRRARCVAAGSGSPSSRQSATCPAGSSSSRRTTITSHPGGSMAPGRACQSPVRADAPRRQYLGHTTRREGSGRFLQDAPQPASHRPPSASR